jgi:long-chain acyl-CoA synthetase
MSFIEDIFVQLNAAENLMVLEEIREGAVTGVTGAELLELVAKARTFLAGQGLKKGDRCGLLAPNGIRWVAFDLAAMAEGLIVVPLYSRQAPSELQTMIQDCTPALICCGDSSLRDSIVQGHTEAPKVALMDDAFSEAQAGPMASVSVGSSDPVTIIYTSGTSGESKGVVLTAANVGFMLGCTSARLDQLMQGRPGQDRVFHYLPFNFGAAWIAVLTFLLRRSRVTLNTDLTKLAADMRLAAPDYFLNVPQLLERMRRAVDEQLWKTGGIVQAIYSRAKGAWARRQDKQTQSGDEVWLWLAGKLIFPSIRKKMIGSNLKALICGSAALNPDTQSYFLMLGISVLQVYGLTETTAICTMDDPDHAEFGKVGPAVPGIEMRLSDDEEIIVRGPNIFAKYWNRPLQTGEALRDGWFHTGDQGEMDGSGNWRIVGRIKNLIILGSGHKISPEAIEDEIGKSLPGAQQVVVVGNGRGYLCAVVTGELKPEQVQAALDAVNQNHPHYKQVRGFVIHRETFTVDSGLLTVNGKLKRDAIASRLKNEIENLYRVKQAV